MSGIEGTLRYFERERRQRERFVRQYEKEQFERFLDRVIRWAEDTPGVTVPTTVELRLLNRLAKAFNGPFSASQVVRRGWCGIRSAKDATRKLEQFVANGWLQRALPNREDHARYAFTKEYALGNTGAITLWPEFDPTEALIEAEFLRPANDDGDDDGEAEAECGIEALPDPSAEGELWDLARFLAFGKRTRLHEIADCIEGLTPIQCAFAIAFAQWRVSGDPVPTPIRGVAEYLEMDYNALRAGVAAATEAIRNLNMAAAA